MGRCASLRPLLLMYGNNFIDLLPQKEMNNHLEFLLPENRDARSFSRKLVLSASNAPAL